MILRSLTKHIREQNWFAVLLDFLIVIIRVFIGIQVANWNEARLGEQRRTQTIDSLKTNLGDLISVQERFVAEISQGLSGWETAHAREGRPPPFYYRIEGSDHTPEQEDEQ